MEENIYYIKIIERLEKEIKLLKEELAYEKRWKNLK